jgi:hypothetical protein
METKIVKITQATFDIWIGSKSKWYTPYKVDNENTLEQIQQKYRQHILNSSELSSELHTLKGKKLGCLCSLLVCTPRKCSFGGELLKLINE